MPLLIRCPNNHRLSVPSRRAGQVVTCPQCGAATKVPGPEVVAAAKAGLPGGGVSGAAAGAVPGGGKSVKPAAPPPVPGRKKLKPERAAVSQDTPRDIPADAPPVPAADASQSASQNRPGGQGAARPVSKSKFTKPPPLPGRPKPPTASSKKGNPPRPDRSGKKAAVMPADAPVGSQRVAPSTDSPGDGQLGKAAADESSRSPSGASATGSGSTRPSAKEMAAKKTRWRGDPENQEGLAAAGDPSAPGYDSSAAGAAGGSDQSEPQAADGKKARRVLKPATASDGERRPDVSASDAGQESANSRRKEIDLLADTAEIAMSLDAAHAANLADEGSQPNAPPPLAAEPAAAADTLPAVTTDTPATQVASAATSDLAAAADSGKKDQTAEVAAPAPVPPPTMARSAPPKVPAPPAAAPPVAAAHHVLEEPEPAPVGIYHPREKRHTVYLVAAGMVVVAAVSMVPAVREIVLHFLAETSPGIGPWSPFVLLLSFVQLAYVLYVVQLPDWGSTRVMMVLTVVIAMVYAAGLGFSVTTDAHNELILSLGYSRQQMIAWCLLILLLMCSLAYVWARITFKWKKDYFNTVVSRG